MISNNSDWDDKEFETKLSCISGTGGQNESTFSFISNVYQGIVDKFCNPERKTYTLSEIKIKTNKSISDYCGQENVSSQLFDFDIHEESISVPNFPASKVKLVYWENKSNRMRDKTSLDYATNCDINETGISDALSNNEDYCILYLHTNSRNLLQAVEVLPICCKLGMNVVAFDMPAHGDTHSENEVFSAALSVASIDAVIDYTRNTFNVHKFIIWGRGMATAAAIEYCGSLQQNDNTNSYHSILSFLPSWLTLHRGVPSSNSDSSSDNKPAAVHGVDSAVSRSFSCSNVNWNEQIYLRSSSSSSTLSSSSSSSTTLRLGKSVSAQVLPVFRNESTSSKDPANTPNEPLNSKFKFKNVEHVKCLILDSPFTSIPAIVNDAVSKFQRGGYPLPTFVFDFAIGIVKSSVTSKLGFDPYTLKPIEFLPYIQLPVYIMAANNDDYIQAKQSIEVKKYCTLARICKLVEFQGTHNSDRPISLHAGIATFIEQYCLSS